MSRIKFLTAAKAVYDNQPDFENRTLDHKSVNEIADELKKLVAKKWIGKDWINGVNDAIENGQAVYITFGDDRNWGYFTMKDKTATREDIMNQLASMDLKNAEVKRCNTVES